jgi:hypothetical protein
MFGDKIIRVSSSGVIMSFIKLAIVMSLLITTVHASEKEYTALRKEYFSQKVKIQMRFCTDKYLKVSQMSKKELKKKMKKQQGSAWERFFLAHKSLPEFSEKCLEEIESVVQKECKGKENSKPVGLPSITVKKKAKNILCSDPSVKKLVKLEAEATAISAIVQRYDNIKEPMFQPVGLPSITPMQQDFLNDSEPDQPQVGLPSITPEQSAEEKAKEAAKLAMAKAMAIKAMEQAKKVVEAKQNAKKAVAIAKAKEALRITLVRNMNIKLAELGACLAKSMSRIPASENMSEGRKRATAESECKTIRSEYKELREQKMKLDGDIED